MASRPMQRAASGRVGEQLRVAAECDNPVPTELSRLKAPRPKKRDNGSHRHPRVGISRPPPSRGGREIPSFEAGSLTQLSVVDEPHQVRMPDGDERRAPGIPLAVNPHGDRGQAPQHHFTIRCEIEDAAGGQAHEAIGDELHSCFWHRAGRATLQEVGPGSARAAGGQSATVRGVREVLLKKWRKIFVYNTDRMLRFLTAGESHGKALVVILEGMPAGLRLDFDGITRDLQRRQAGYGRGRRMAIESDSAEVLSGVRAGETLGGPIAMLIPNRDWVNWQQTMQVDGEPLVEAGVPSRPPVSRPRPGHADLAGVAKYGRTDIRDVLERASARETAARVAAGALARQLLSRFGIDVTSHVLAIGGVTLEGPGRVTFEQARAIAADSPLRCVDPELERRMIAEIDRAKAAGDTVGGVFEVIARGVPMGLGSYAQWDRKLDGRLAQAMMSIPAIKAVGIGRGPAAAALDGSRMHDEIVPATDAARPGDPPHGLARPTNNAGGLEGGVTNGEEVRVTGYMKPISTLMRPLRSVDLSTMTAAPATVERSDVCAVPAAAIVGEAMICLVLADALLEKFGGDSIDEIERNHQAAVANLRARFSP